MKMYINILSLVLAILYGSLNISYGATITSNATGNWNVGSTWVGGVVPASADDVIISGGHTVTLAAGITMTGSLTVSGTLQLAGFSMTCGSLQGAGIITSSSGTPTLTSGGDNTSTIFSGVIGPGAIALSKNGTGTLTLSGSNTYSGLTTIAAGTLILNNADALGTTSGATIVANGAVLDLNGINYSNPEILTLSGTGISSGGALINSSATPASYAGNITLTTTSPSITANNPITLSGIISGGNASGINSLTVLGNSTLTGTLTLSGNNTYTGLTTINSGALLKIGANNALGAAAPNGTTDANDGNSTIINSGGVLDLNGITYTQFEGVRMNGAGFFAAGNGCIINGSSTTAIYRGCIDSYSPATLYVANPITFNGMIQCRYNNSITKTGSGILTIAPTGGDRTAPVNPFISAIIISSGTLKLGANLTETGSASVYTQIANGAVLDLNGFTCARQLYLSGTGISSGGALINSSSTPATHSGLVILESPSSIIGETGTIALSNNGTMTGATFGLTLGGAAGGSIASVIGTTSGTVTKIDAGTWTLSGLNTYTGATTVSGGILRATNNTVVASTNGPFGNNASALYLNGGTIQSNVATFSRPITVSATNSGLDGYGSARTISSAINNATGSTSYNLNIGGTVNGVLEGQNLTLSGVITNTPGTLSLTKIGTNTVTLSNATVTIQSLTINAGTVVSTSGVLNLAGDFSNNGTFTHNGGTVTFNGASAQSIGGTSTTTFSGLRINKTANDVTLNRGILVSTLLTFTQQYIQSTTTNPVTFNDNATHTGASNLSHVVGPVRKTGNDAFTFPVGKNGFYRQISIGAPGVVTDQFTGEYFETDPNSLYLASSKDATLDHVSGCEYWTLDRTSGTSNVNVTLSWNTNSCGVNNLPDLRVARWNGTTWKDHGNGGTAGNTTAGTVQSAGVVNSFSPFTLASSSSLNPLPIELLRFTAKPNGNVVDITWTTATETNNHYFIIEKSKDGFSFEKVDSVSGAGNSRVKINYQVKDYRPNKGLSYYRLKQVDFDGKFKNSKLIAVRFEGNFHFSFTVFPNPSAGETNLSFTGIDDVVKEILLSVYDIKGNVVFAKKIATHDLQKNAIAIDLFQKLHSGIYIIFATTGEHTYRQKLVID